MKRYLVLRTNHGFQGRFWQEGLIVSFEDNVVPNKHFELITKETKLPVAEKDQVSPVALSEMQNQSKKAPTAAQALKDQTGVAQKPLSEAEKVQLANLDEGKVGADAPQEQQAQETQSSEGQGAI